MVRVKVCGITRRADAEYAARLGAWAIGLVFAESPRQVTPEAARRITRDLDLHILKIGVFVDSGQDAILEAVGSCRLDAVQLHGNETPALCGTLRKGGVKVIKAIRMQGRESLDNAPSFEGACDFLLLDTYSKGQSGGTGKAFNWDWAREAKSRVDLPIILSGGIHPGNVLEALSQVQPYALDASSGLEEAPGRKSAQLMKTLFDTLSN